MAAGPANTATRKLLPKTRGGKETLRALAGLNPASKIVNFWRTAISKILLMRKIIMKPAKTQIRLRRAKLSLSNRTNKKRPRRNKRKTMRKILSSMWKKML